MNVFTNLPIKTVVRQVNTGEGTARVQLHYGFGSNAEHDDMERGFAHCVEHLTFKGTNPDKLVPKGLYQKCANDFYQQFYRDGITCRELQDKLMTTVQNERDAREVLDLLTRTGCLFLSETDITAIARRFGATLNAYTSADATSYHFQFPSHNLEPFIQILSSELCNSRMCSDHFNSEIKAILQEKLAGENNAVRIGLKKLREAMYDVSESNHYITIGTDEALGNVSGQKLKDFYFRNYIPKNATLYIFGPFDDKMVNTTIPNMVNKYFSHINNEGAKFTPVKPKPKYLESSFYTEYHPCIQTDQMMIAFRTTVDPALEYGEYLSFVCNGPDNLFDTELVQTGEVMGASLFTEEYQTDLLVYILLELAPNNAPHDLIQKVCTLIQTHGDYPVNQRWKLSNQMSNQSIDAIMGQDIQCDRLLHRYRKPKPPTRPSTQWIHQEINADKAHVVLLKEPTSKMKPMLEQCTNKKQETLRQMLEHHKRTSKLEVPCALKLYKHIHYENILPLFVNLHLEDNVLTYNSKKVITSCALLNNNILQMSGTIESILMGIAAECRQQALSREPWYREARKNGCIFGIDAYNITALGPNARDLLHYLFEEEADLTIALNTVLQQTRHNIINKMNDSVSRFMHEVHKLCIPKPEYNWGTDDVLKALRCVTAKSLEDLWIRNWSAVTAIEFKNCQPRRQKYFEPVDMNVLPHSTFNFKSVKPKLVSIKLGKSQMCIGLARAGMVKYSTVEYNVLYPLINFILFGSLGSKLFKIRESTGLFYSAFGKLGNAANVVNECGYDVIMLQIDPQNETKAIEQLRGFLHSLGSGDITITENELYSAKTNILRSLNESVAPGNLLDTLTYYHSRGLKEYTYAGHARSMAKAVMKVQLCDITKLIQVLFKNPFYHYVCVN